MEQTSDILIIGAGAAGLMAAYRLSTTGRTVTVLEARDRIGGRIHTIDDPSFSGPLELGAEFVHGTLPLTLQLLQAAGIPYEVMAGDSWTSEDGRLHQEDAMGAYWPRLMQKLDDLEEDCSIRVFLDREFGDEKYRDLRRWVTRFAEGYDAADAGKASAFALREEWKGEEEDQYRITGGYGRLLQYLHDQCRAAGVRILLQQPVSAIQWQRGQVSVQTAAGGRFRAEKIILTLPVGVWQDANCAPAITPALTAQLKAFRDIGFGPVIKFLLEFRQPFWQDKSMIQQPDADLGSLGFLFSGEAIPTWWTQLPNDRPLLTGWLAGPKAAAMMHQDEEALLNAALQSLSGIFRMEAGELSSQLTAWRVANWARDPYARGAYAYATVATPEARRTLSEPVADTFYFAGEALYEGPAMGTVEAALQSGHRAAVQLSGNLIRV